MRESGFIVHAVLQSRAAGSVPRKAFLQQSDSGGILANRISPGIWCLSEDDMVIYHEDIML